MTVTLLVACLLSALPVVVPAAVSQGSEVAHVIDVSLDIITLLLKDAMVRFEEFVELYINDDTTIVLSSFIIVAYSSTY